MYSIIPEDLLFKTYFGERGSNDLLTWMFGTKHFTKLKLNQVLLNVCAILIQGTNQNMTGFGQDKRIGLDINKEC